MSISRYVAQLLQQQEKEKSSAKIRQPKNFIQGHKQGHKQGHIEERVLTAEKGGVGRGGGAGGWTKGGCTGFANRICAPW
jgi:hypothetical protein